MLGFRNRFGSKRSVMTAAFDSRVHAVVVTIPSARLATYGQVADWIGAYGCARQVGWALRRLTLPSPIPWHRVVNAQGRISMCLSREGSDWMQRQMLIAEGIPVDDAGRLPLKRFLWTPEPQAIREALGLEPHRSDPLPPPMPPSTPSHG
jgi:methylated-DNA-protein-cysteine methyltransferase-like protein